MNQRIPVLFLLLFLSEALLAFDPADSIPYEKHPMTLKIIGGVGLASFTNDSAMKDIPYDETVTMPIDGSIGFEINTKVSQSNFVGFSYSYNHIKRFLNGYASITSCNQGNGNPNGPCYTFNSDLLTSYDGNNFSFLFAHRFNKTGKVNASIQINFGFSVVSEHFYFNYSTRTEYDIARVHIGGVAQIKVPFEFRISPVFEIGLSPVFSGQHMSSSSDNSSFHSAYTYYSDSFLLRYFLELSAVFRLDHQ
jgi:hypothetical protein